MTLTPTQVDMLFYLEHVGGLPQSTPYARAQSADLLALKAEGLVRLTPSRESWVLTDDGRKQLVAIDGQIRLTIQPWGRGAHGAPS